MMHRRVTRKPDGRQQIFYSASRPIDPAPQATSPEPKPLARSGHMRWHPLRQEWVPYALHRQHRTFLPPPEYNPLAARADIPTECAPGNWDMTVFDNLFPALVEGACEVVVFSQDPSGSLANLPLAQVELLLRVWADRTRELGAREDVRYVMPFENRGVEVGVTLHHPHGQIYAYPFIPPLAQKELAAQSAHWQEHGRGLFADHIATEKERMLYEGDAAVAFVPVCARYAYEVWVAPRRAVPTFAELNDADIVDLARALKTTLLKLDGLWKRPMPYILVWHQAPTDGQAHPEAHVHAEIYPAYRMRDRLKYLAGSELGAGVFTADTLPEERALELQAVQVSLA